MPKKFSKGSRAKERAQENSLVNGLDELSEFMKFREEILPILRKQLVQGATAEDIYKKFQAVAAARSVSIAMTEIDSTKAMAAIKDILDRSAGKPTEKREVTHKYGQLKDQELDALLTSELQEVAGDDEEAPTH